MTTSLVLLGIAALAYPVFYYNYIPKKVVSIPVHLQYKYVCPFQSTLPLPPVLFIHTFLVTSIIYVFILKEINKNLQTNAEHANALQPPSSAGLNPYGIAHLSSQLATEQAYDVTVELTLPRSPTNVERGNFMVALYALKSQPENPAFAFGVPSLSALSDPYAHVTPNSVVFSSRRPALLPYRDPLVSRASRLLFLPYHILFPAAEATTTLSIPMGELVEFVGGSGSGRQQLPLSVLVDVQAGQALQVYSASVTLVARLSGLRWAMYNHRVISFTVGTTAFWIAEMLSMGAAWLLIAQCFSGGHREEFDGNRAGRLRGMAPSSRGELPGGDLSGVKQDEEEDDDVKIKEESTEQETLVGDLPRHGGGGDADDEEDGDDIWKESRSGTSGFHDGKGGSIRRRSSRGSIRS